jgi:hypothetical protein
MIFSLAVVGSRRTATDRPMRSASSSARVARRTKIRHETIEKTERMNLSQPTGGPRYYLYFQLVIPFWATVFCGRLLAPDGLPKCASLRKRPESGLSFSMERRRQRTGQSVW